MKKILMAIMMVTTLTLVPATVQAKKTIHLGQFKLTAYCPCYECSESYGRKCAMVGHYCRSNHTVAVDPSVINLGDTILINGKKYKAEDTGGSVVGETIDIFFDTHEEVENFGVRYGDVVIVR